MSNPEVQQKTYTWEKGVFMAIGSMISLWGGLCIGVWLCDEGKCPLGMAILLAVLISCITFALFVGSLYYYVIYKKEVNNPPISTLDTENQVLTNKE